MKADAEIVKLFDDIEGSEEGYDTFGHAADDLEAMVGTLCDTYNLSIEECLNALALTVAQRYDLTWHWSVDTEGMQEGGEEDTVD